MPVSKVKRHCSVRSARVIGCLAAATLLLGAASAQDSFEIASVKVADPYKYPVEEFRVYPGGRVVVTNFPLRAIMAVAHDVSEYRVTGGPPWVNDETLRYNSKTPNRLACCGVHAVQSEGLLISFPNLPRFARTSRHDAEAACRPL